MIAYGYAGRLGVVDLSKGQVTTRSLDEKLISDYLGGRGFVARLVYDLVPPGADPLGPDNVLVFAVGPLNGTVTPTSARFSIGAKSPLTGITGGGNAGSFWGPNLKWAGFDGVIVRGQAAEPVYLLIRDRDIRIVPATNLCGLDTWKAAECIREECEDPWLRVACIGAAGERGVLLANVGVGRFRAAGRGGLGAVMGSKNLKAIAVRGTGPVHVYDPEALWERSQDITKRAVKKGYLKYRLTYGDYGGFRRQADHGALMTRNAQTGVFPEADAIDGDAFNKRARIGIRACFGCPIPCWVRFVIPDGPYAGFYGENLNTTILKELGPRCGMTDLDSLLAALVALDRYGLDAISVPIAIAFAMECYQRGIITTADTGGLELDWGRADVVLTLIEQMAHNEGFGGELGQGVRICAQRWGRGAEKYAFHVKGLEVVGTDPRGYHAWGLGYATSSRGACHMRAYSTFEYGQMTEEEMIHLADTTAIRDRFGCEGKGRAVAYLEDMRCVGDSLEMCHWLTRATFGLPQEQVGLLSAATGRAITPEELKRIGERIYNIEHLFNLREGATPADDTLPERFLKEPIPEGPSKGQVCPLEPMLEEYYAARDWNRQTGYPSPDKRTELGI
jgi:aldehyde:ferredoxin oxidoreductase